MFSNWASKRPEVLPLVSQGTRAGKTNYNLRASLHLKIKTVSPTPEINFFVPHGLTAMPLVFLKDLKKKPGMLPRRSPADFVPTLRTSF